MLSMVIKNNIKTSTQEMRLSRGIRQENAVLSKSEKSIKRALEKSDLQMTLFQMI